MFAWLPSILLHAMQQQMLLYICEASMSAIIGLVQVLLH